MLCDSKFSFLPENKVTVIKALLFSLVDLVNVCTGTIDDLDGLLKAPYHLTYISSFCTGSCKDRLAAAQQHNSLSVSC
jgi:hypothetical protein